MPINNTTPAAASDDSATLALFETLALAAGRAIMEVFHSGFDVKRKEDASPVTEADRAAERIILEGLRRSFPGIPCVAEEETAEGLCPKDPGRVFFLVDPLDGTKEFVGRRGDFTVNIALIREGVPEIGIVYAPASRKCFVGQPGRAEEITVSPDHQATGRRAISVRAGKEPLTVVASRSHCNAETEAYIHDLGPTTIVSVGSSLKFCMVASGEADIYPRFSRTMEWDTAAGDAVLRAAGGTTLTLDGLPLTYGKISQSGEADYANPSFIAKGAS
ncbi:3'(2'),5'-bisphosphate nucleotidase CysQ [Mesorhizobium sp. L-8-10]|uniref:3'(2'),5'-bisphosphate nucleotidase CysQ n=1 Tax=Mesorhizobium sp. L-8-10 TaxID=2744523 RepID=UPI001925ED97|nr:3'(2'),5'-bisphosphate nucleotidase CysQ [Mesorhizobium sp. L-8-10]BCH34071.1 3'(2'),5'-bisphosphate nucleotidase CysQ [Mesorhizobium sp. L-8-10]